MVGPGIRHSTSGTAPDECREQGFITSHVSERSGREVGLEERVSGWGAQWDQAACAL